MLLYMEVSSTALVLLMALVASLRNWLNSPKSPKRLKVFNFNLEYETFCELTQPKLFKTEAECSLDRLFNLLSG